MRSTIIFIIGLLLSFLCGYAQTYDSKGPDDFLDLIVAKIQGAPTLGKPFLVKGTVKPIHSAGHGLAAPAFFDWDGDGLKDLLIGEFGSGIENGRYVGNFIRIYKNVGTESQPEFSGAFDYARHPFEFPGSGTPYSVDQFCCIGFTPQFIDLNADGKEDLITGQYYGEVSWFRGSEAGFMPGEFLQQQSSAEGVPRHEPKGKERKAHQFYWLYSSSSFGDFTSDEKPDLIVGGMVALRISKNIGTATEPRFGQRELLLDIKGNPLKIYDYNEEELKLYEQLKFLGYEPPIAGDDHLTPYVADWDNDGLSDLLVTNSYVHRGLNTIDFFKGVQTKDGYRFQPAVPLFTTKNNIKAFPGSAPRIAVIDWNNDGVKDLLIGMSVVTVRDQLNNTLSWNWEKDMELPGAGKDPSNLGDLTQENLRHFQQNVKLPIGITMDDYMTIRHQGYVYVMLGSKEDKSFIPDQKIKKRKQ
jgi:hypothetical protein